MSGIKEQIEQAVAEIESEATRDDLIKCNRRIGILTEQLRRQVAHRDALALQLGATVAAAAHTDALLDAVLPNGDPADECQLDPERWDGLS